MSLLSQYCWRPPRQLAQIMHESTMQPTAARSPTLKAVTAEPTLVTRPAISCPGTQGYIVPGHSLRAACRSEWQTPQNRMSHWTSRGPGSRRSRVKGRKGDTLSKAAYERALLIDNLVTKR